MEPLGTPAKKPSPAPRRRKKVRIPGLWRHNKTGRWYYSPMRYGQRLNINLETKDPDEARTRALELYNNLAALGMPNELDSEISTYLRQKASSNRHSRATAKQRPYVLQKFASWANARSLKIATFHGEDAKDYYRYLQKQTNPKTGKALSEITVQSYILSGVAPFFEWLRKKRKVILKNPFEDLELDALLPHEDGVRTYYCSQGERDAILRECQKIPKTVLSPVRAKWIAFVLHAGFEAGLRKNEIIEARPEWFDLKKGILKVSANKFFHTKTRRNRVIPLSATFRRFLKTYPLKGEYCIAPNGKERRKRKPGARIKKPRPAALDAAPKIREYRYDFEKPYKVVMGYIGKKLGADFSRVTPHVMRHTFATLLSFGNVSLYKIAKWLGDSPKTTEKHYAHVDGPDKDIDKLHARAAPRKKARR